MTEEEKRLRELLTKESVDAYHIHIVERCMRIVESDEAIGILARDRILAALKALKDNP